MRSQHGVHVLRVETGAESPSAPHRHFDARSRTLYLSSHLQPGQQAFQHGTQLARLELSPQIELLLDGRVYLWIARSIRHEDLGWGAPGKTFSFGLGCDVQHAHRLVYSKGLDLRNLDAATPIGMGCKVCERSACPQRAFPFVGKPLRVNGNESGFVPYSA